MDADVLKNLTDPAVLFFVLGVVVGLIRSNLEIPAPVAKFLSLYLLMALGFKGGHALADSGLTGEGIKVVGAALLLAFTIPALCFAFLRRKINAFDAAAIAATYGSVSAVTFVTASQFIAGRGETPGGYLTVALVLMESPAIIMAVLLATWVRTRQAATAGTDAADSAGAVALGASGRLATADSRAIVPEAEHPSGQAGPEETGVAHEGGPLSVKEVLREAFTDGAHLLLIGSMIIGAVSGDAGNKAMGPFVYDMFKGMLALFLLEMGLLVARQLREVRDVGPFLVGFGLIVPLVNASAAMALGTLLGMNAADLTLLATLAASGSYIVVPAVIRYAIPEARPSRYFTLALGITFPLNIAIGIPLYYEIAHKLVG